VSDRGTFTLSLDFELIWGGLDRGRSVKLERACKRERSQVFEPLLGMLEEFEIEATWCVVGHLMLGSCAPLDGRKHPEIVRPRRDPGAEDWFERDPGGDERGFPAYYGRSLVERLLEARVPQEIGCHSFSHVIFGDPGCTRETAASEVAASVAIARGLGIELRSFAFPRNSVGHLDVLRDHGFTCFRGPEPTWHRGGGPRGPASRIGHLADVIAARTPPVVDPRPVDGLVDVPASMLYFPAHGGRRFVPVGRRVRRALRGVDRAARDRRVFHLWFHPTNLAYETGPMLDGLRTVLAHVARRRDRGELEVSPMARVAGRLRADTLSA
jgi:hypothetical protein